MLERFPEARENNIQHASYEEIEAILQDVIYSKLQMLTSEVISMLDWDLIECYGLISTAADRKGPFNPLVEHGALLHSISSDSIGKGSFFAVQVADYLVVTGLVEPANE